jgi:hypothetical protein
MRILYLILIFIFVFALLYFILSLFGLLFVHPCSYWKIISDTGWFVGYSLFIGTWAPISIVNEEYERLQAKDATITI